MAADRSRITHVLLALMLLALLAVIGMLANDARGGPLDPTDPPGSTDGVRLPGTPVTGSTTITAPGYYYVTRDLLGVNIVINADNVTLDLGGFTLSRPFPFAGTGVLVTPGRMGIVVRNGGIGPGYATGINTTATESVITDMRLGFNATGVILGEKSVLENCTVTGNGTAVQIVGHNARIRECHITFNQVLGVSVGVGVGGALIERSSIMSNNTDVNSIGGGIRTRGFQATIRDSELNGNVIADLVFEGAQVPNPSSNDNVVMDNVFRCPTSIVNLGSNNFIPINSTDPHTNRTHLLSC